jgi:hypothetical protein
VWKDTSDGKAYTAIWRKWCHDTEVFNSGRWFRTPSDVVGSHEGPQTQLHPVSKVNISFHIASIFTGLFCSFHYYSWHSFLHELLFNCSERKIGSNVSHTMNKGARCDTLLIASGCTLLIGEDNCSSLQATESILEAGYPSFFNVASLNVQYKLKMFQTP